MLFNNQDIDMTSTIDGNNNVVDQDMNIDINMNSNTMGMGPNMGMMNTGAPIMVDVYDYTKLSENAKYAITENADGSVAMRAGEYDLEAEIVSF